VDRGKPERPPIERDPVQHDGHRNRFRRLERTGGRYGLQTMCEGGGQANVTIIERL
jgi:hypothetical protein